MIAICVPWRHRHPEDMRRTHKGTCLPVEAPRLDTGIDKGVSTCYRYDDEALSSSVMTTGLQVSQSAGEAAEDFHTQHTSIQGLVPMAHPKSSGYTR